MSCPLSSDRTSSSQAQRVDGSWLERKGKRDGAGTVSGEALMVGGLLGLLRVQRHAVTVCHPPNAVTYE